MSAEIAIRGNGSGSRQLLGGGPTHRGSVGGEAGMWCSANHGGASVSSVPRFPVDLGVPFEEGAPMLNLSGAATLNNLTFARALTGELPEVSLVSRRSSAASVMRTTPRRPDGKALLSSATTEDAGLGDGPSTDELALMTSSSNSLASRLLGDSLYAAQAADSFSDSIDNPIQFFNLPSETPCIMHHPTGPPSAAIDKGANVSPPPPPVSQEDTRKLKPMKLQFFRTKMCPWVLSLGHCRKGESCRYAHCPEDLRPLPDLTKTKMCDQYLQTGRCPLGADKCKYAHTMQELRATTSFIKTKICPLWAQGSCTLGGSCRFAHGEAELRGAPSPRSDVPSQSAYPIDNGHCAGASDPLSAGRRKPTTSTDSSDALLRAPFLQTQRAASSGRQAESGTEWAPHRPSLLSAWSNPGEDVCTSAGPHATRRGSPVPRRGRVSNRGRSPRVNHFPPPSSTNRDVASFKQQRRSRDPPLSPSQASSVFGQQIDLGRSGLTSASTLYPPCQQQQPWIQGTMGTPQQRPSHSAGMEGGSSVPPTPSGSPLVIPAIAGGTLNVMSPTSLQHVLVCLTGMPYPSSHPPMATSESLVGEQDQVSFPPLYPLTVRTAMTDHTQNRQQHVGLASSGHYLYFPAEDATILNLSPPGSRLSPGAGADTSTPPLGTPILIAQRAPSAGGMEETAAMGAAASSADSHLTRSPTCGSADGSSSSLTAETLCGLGGGDTCRSIRHLLPAGMFSPINRAFEHVGGRGGGSSGGLSQHTRSPRLAHPTPSSPSSTPHSQHRNKNSSAGASLTVTSPPPLCPNLPPTAISLKDLSPGGGNILFTPSHHPLPVFPATTSPLPVLHLTPAHAASLPPQNASPHRAGTIATPVLAAAWNRHPDLMAAQTATAAATPSIYQRHATPMGSRISAPPSPLVYTAFASPAPSVAGIPIMTLPGRAMAPPTDFTAQPFPTESPPPDSTFFVVSSPASPPQPTPSYMPTSAATVVRGGQSVTTSAQDQSLATRLGDLLQRSETSTGEGHEDSRYKREKGELSPPSLLSSTPPSSGATSTEASPQQERGNAQVSCVKS